MPWKECHVMDERLRFVARLIEGETMVALCEEFRISRKTGHKIWQRTRQSGCRASPIAADDRTATRISCRWWSKTIVKIKRSITGGGPPRSANGSGSAGPRCTVPPSARCMRSSTVCEANPEKASDHDGCREVGEPCLLCNASNPPRAPLGYVSLVTSGVIPPAILPPMADDASWMFHNSPQAPPRQPKPGERLFEFVRLSDRAPMSAELRFHGESYGWETQFFERGELVWAHGAFLTREGAIRWAEDERRRLETQGQRW